jgi:hypothetical protein
MEICRAEITFMFLGKTNEKENQGNMKILYDIISNPFGRANMKFFGK